MCIGRRPGRANSSRRYLICQTTRAISPQVISESIMIECRTLQLNPGIAAWFSAIT